MRAAVDRLWDAEMQRLDDVRPGMLLRVRIEVCSR
jgi:hypothetical protein